MKNTQKGIYKSRYLNIEEGEILYIREKKKAKAKVEKKKVKVIRKVICRI